MLEMAILGPWIFFLFIGALDMGFYAYALISLQAAARSAALYTSTDSSTKTQSGAACTIVLGEMKYLRNAGTDCSSNPTVAATAWTGPDSSAGAQVSVTYQTLPLIPIPGLLSKQFTITRVVRMRLRG
jgi:Flp pilus assembly protein TadG